MKRIISGVLALAVLAPTLSLAQQNDPPRSKAAKIQNAQSAAPSDISGKATIMDWPAAEGARPVQLRAGTNGWVCYPDMPTTKGNDPADPENLLTDATWIGATFSGNQTCGAYFSANFHPVFAPGNYDLRPVILSQGTDGQPFTRDDFFNLQLTP